MQSQIVFIDSLSWHLDQLHELLGDRWPKVKAVLNKLLNELAAETNERALPARVNRIFRVFEGTPAEPFVRALFQQAGVLDLKSQPGTRIFGAAVEPEVVGLATAKAQLGRAATVLADAVALTADAREAAIEDRAQHVNAWITERVKDPTRPLNIGERFTLNFGVGKRVPGSIIGGSDTNVHAQDLAGGGLQTEWLVSTSGFDLTSDDPQVVLYKVSSSMPGLCSAKFSLWIPEQGESDVRWMFIVPRSQQNCRLEVLIYAVRNGRKELYRQFSVEMHVAVTGTAAGEAKGLSVRDELICAPSAEMNLRTTHEWTTPPGRFIVTVLPGTANAAVNGECPGGPIQSEIVDWQAQPALIAGSIRNVRDSAEKFRAKWEGYLNDVDAQDLLHRLTQFKPTYDWAQWQSRADSQHSASWVKASTSQELHDLAIYGHDLYETVFPPNSQLRVWIDSLLPGYRLDIGWTEACGAGFVPNVPLGLMYLPDPPGPGGAIDPLGFLALRFRIDYRGYKGVSGASRALGGLATAHQAYCLYWGAQVNDETGQESLWQRQQLQGWPNQACVPRVPGSPGARAEVIQALSAPPESPTSLLYFFCQAAAGDGNRPVLRFGSTSGPADVLQTTDLIGSKPLVDQPLVFANACTTSAADPYIANLFQQGLFRRGCRGFLGTETKVPIQLASRFAAIFFNFFYRRIDPAPMAAGEALAQTRLFLLTEYANIGGIFYAYLNQYELFMADEAEVHGLRAP